MTKENTDDKISINDLYNQLGFLKDERERFAMASCTAIRAFLMGELKIIHKQKALIDKFFKSNAAENIIDNTNEDDKC